MQKEYEKTPNTPIHLGEGGNIFHILLVKMFELCFFLSNTTHISCKKPLAPVESKILQ